MIPRYFVVAESAHELQNPTSKEKILEAGSLLGLGPDSRVLDVASGRGGPALFLASAYGCAIEGVEISPDFHGVADARIAAAGLANRVSFKLADASKETFAPEAYDVALCLGASFVWGGLSGTLDALDPVVRPGGHIVVGEPYWRSLPLPEDYEDRSLPFTTLEGTVDIIESGGLAVVSMLDSSLDDWDRYETQHWDALERWLAATPEHPDAGEIRARYEREKRNYLRHQRELLGWAIFVGRKQG
ncbi:MAG: class I SAM-dependent methyltransferase [Actinobacteria bacterium]|nr:class I SAM-dependent methyltransferase [Actinomycetota bacterium]